MNVMTDQINNHTSIWIREIKEQTEKITKFLEEKKTAQLRTQKGACYICQDPGHYAPDCPTRRDPDYQGNKKNHSG